MALTKDKKTEIISETVNLLSSSKMTVIAAYPGTTVKAMQDLRRQGLETGTTIRVIKNRLVKQAMKQTENLKDTKDEFLNGQLLYAFNADDEVAPAQALANFAKMNPTLEFIGAITGDGQIVDADNVKVLASLPSRDQLRAQLVGTIAAPLSGFLNVLSGNVRGVLNVLLAHAEQM